MMSLEGCLAQLVLNMEFAMIFRIICEQIEVGCTPMGSLVKPCPMAHCCKVAIEILGEVFMLGKLPNIPE